MPRRDAPSTMVSSQPLDAARWGNDTMGLAHAFAAGGLAARHTERRFRTTEAEVREAEQRVIERRTAVVVASARREYTERGRHAAPRPASA